MSEEKGLSFAALEKLMREQIFADMQKAISEMTWGKGLWDLGKSGAEVCAKADEDEERDEEVAKEEVENKYKSVSFERTGNKMVLPAGMGYDEAIYHLQIKQKEEESPVSIREEIDAFPYDGAYMLMRVLQDRYGWASPAPVPGFFGDSPPTMVGLEIAPGEFAQIIWGGFSMPGIEGTLQCGSENKDGRLIFVMRGKVKKKNETAVRDIAAEVRRRILVESVYKGKAIRLTTDDDGDLLPEAAPKFIDVSKVREHELILPTDVREQVETNIFTPIERTEVCRTMGVPLKSGILLEGTFGTGKTLTAYVTAKKCVENNWTYIYLDRVSGLKAALQFARQYMPVVVFAEDIDRVIDGDERTVDHDDVLNTIDGIESKGTEIMTILTTNNASVINKAMLRPGRIDSVISFVAPDMAAAEQLVRMYAGKLLSKTAGLEEAAAELDGQIPAVIREVVERSKRHAIFRMGNGEKLSLCDADIAKAARSMKHHLELMAPRQKPAKSEEARFGAAMHGLIKKSLSKQLDGSQIVGTVEDGDLRATLQ